MKKSELLLQARNLIAAKKKKYICYALHEIGYKHKDIKTASQLQNWIQEDLLDNSYRSYPIWIQKNYPDWPIDPTGFYTVARLQWIDWMIQYWKEKGD